MATDFSFGGRSQHMPDESDDDNNDTDSDSDGDMPRGGRRGGGSGSEEDEEDEYDDEGNRVAGGKRRRTSAEVRSGVSLRSAMVRDSADHASMQPRPMSKTLRRKYQQRKLKYYTSGEYFGQSVAGQVFLLAVLLERADTDAVW